MSEHVKCNLHAFRPKTDRISVFAILKVHWRMSRYVPINTETLLIYCPKFYKGRNVRLQRTINLCSNVNYFKQRFDKKQFDFNLLTTQLKNPKNFFSLQKKSLIYFELSLTAETQCDPKVSYFLRSQTWDIK